MSVQSTARVPTGHASRYLQQVCKHWAHNLAVEFDPPHGTIAFPRDGRGGPWSGDALVTLDAEADTLVCHIAASEPGQLDGVKGALARHVERFAFREAPMQWDWADAVSNPAEA